MPKRSTLQFHNYSVLEQYYKKCSIPDGMNSFNLKPEYTRSISSTSGDCYDVKLSVEILPDVDSVAPFELRASIVGHFSFSDVPEDGTEQGEKFKRNILNQNAVAILFPFLRAIVATLTTNANIPAMLLPVANFIDTDND